MNSRLNFHSLAASHAAADKKKTNKKNKWENKRKKTSISNLTRVITKYKTALQLCTPQTVVFRTLEGHPRTTSSPDFSIPLLVLVGGEKSATWKNFFNRYCKSWRSKRDCLIILSFCHLPVACYWCMLMHELMGNSFCLTPPPTTSISIRFSS